MAVMALCEAAAYYKKQGLTLWDQMLKIYEKYGYYKETLVSVTDLFQRIFAHLLQNALETLCRILRCSRVDCNRS